jgi:hypothetical protein
MTFVNGVLAMWNFSDRAAYQPKPTKQDRQRRDFLNRLIASDGADAQAGTGPVASSGLAPRAAHSAAMMAEQRPVHRPGQPKETTETSTWFGVCADLLQRLQREVNYMVARSLADVRRNPLSQLRAGGLSLGLALSACLTTLGVMILTQSGDAAGLAYAKAVLATRPSLTAPDQPPASKRMGYDLDRVRSAAVVFPILLPAGDRALSALPFQPVFENDRDALGMVIFRDMPDGVALTRGAATTREIWMMAAGALGEAELVADGNAPNNFQLGVDLTDYAGAVYASFVLDVSRATAPVNVPVRSTSAQTGHPVLTGSAVALRRITTPNTLPN